MGDFIEDTNALIPVDAAVQNALKSSTTKVLATPTPREERVLRMRFGIGMNTDHTFGGSRPTVFCYKRTNKTDRSQSIKKIKTP